MRFLAAPWVGLLQGGAWIENARRSNSSAKLLTQKLAAVLGSGPVFPCEASAAFFRMPGSLVARLHERGWRFYKFLEPDVYRLMCAWSTTERQIDEFVDDVRNSLAGKGNDA
jgi:threonine aldolase